MANTPNSASLFPILDDGILPATGLARLAAAATDAGEGHQIEFKALPVRSILNKTSSHRGLSLAYSINPYRGCEFACRYCYARYTHTFFAGKAAAQGEGPDFDDPSLFERLIFLKKDAAWLLEQELRTFPAGEEIAIGTATDPYQPIERTARVTRSLLEIFARRKGHRIGLVTKSNLILRDLDLLTSIAQRNTLVLHVTITTSDTELARRLEPRAPRPDLRFAAVRELRRHGLQAGILCSPLLPGLTDSAEQIDSMARLAAEAGASFFAAEPLFLKPCSRPTFLSFVREHVPHLAPDYTERFREHAFAGKEYRETLRARVSAACRHHGVPQRSMDALLTRDAGKLERTERVAPRQAQLFA